MPSPEYPRLDTARPGVLAVLRRRNFTLMWLALLVSEIGNAFTLTAASILIFRLTGSVLNIGLLMIATAAPSLVVGLIAGVFVDRWDRRRTMIVSDLLRFVLIAALPFAIGASIAWLYVIVALSSAIGQFFNPAHASLLPETAPDEELAAANALIAICTLGTRAVGVAAAGLLATLLVIDIAFYIDALTFAISALCITLVRSAPFGIQKETTLKTVLGDLWIGVRFLADDLPLRWLFVIYIPVFAMFAFVNTISLPFVLRALHGTEFDYGLLGGLESVGFAVGSLLIAAWMGRLREGQWLALSFLLMGLSGIGYAQAPSVAIAMILIFLAGLTNAPSAIARQLLIQRRTSREVRGRVNSVFSVMRDTVFMLGMAAVGLADLFAPRMLALIAALLLLGCGVVALVLPGLRSPFSEWWRIGVTPQPSALGAREIRDGG